MNGILRKLMWLVALLVATVIYMAVVVILTPDEGANADVLPTLFVFGALWGIPFGIMLWWIFLRKKKEAS